MIRELVRSLCGVAPPEPAVDEQRCAVLDWAASGAMHLTGRPERPLVSPAPALALLADVAAMLQWATSVRIDPRELLTGRTGVRRGGQESAGGASRLLQTLDGWCAVTLARQDDLDSVPAILGTKNICDPWAALADAARHRPAIELAARAQLLGVPAAALPTGSVDAVPWRTTRIAPPTARTTLAGALVVDLSSMWAGPLCARLLGQAGADVVKVESDTRPDGARSDPRFFDWLHAGHTVVSLDFHSTALAELLAAADVVIEASRPRALAQLGLAPGMRHHREGQVWLSITGYGRAEPDLVAFGDDAAVAGGLVGWDDGEPVFCADAIADPLSGICAALAVACCVRGGGGRLIDLSMRATAAAFASAPAVPHGPHPVYRDGPTWQVDCPHVGRCQAVLPPC